MAVMDLNGWMHRCGLLQVQYTRYHPLHQIMMSCAVNIFLKRSPRYLDAQLLCCAQERPLLANVIRRHDKQSRRLSSQCITHHLK